MKAGKVAVISIGVVVALTAYASFVPRRRNSGISVPGPAGRNSEYLRAGGGSSEGRFFVQSNPDVNYILGFSVISGNNILAFTRTSILHFDGKDWSFLYRTSNSVIDCMSTDGNYVAFVVENQKSGTGITVAPLIVGFLKGRMGKYELTHLTPFNVPLGHSLTDIRFTGPGEGFVATIFEYSYFKIRDGQDERLSIHFVPRVSHVGSNSGGAQFGTGPSEKTFSMIAINQGVLARAEGDSLHIISLLNIYKNDIRSFESDETLISSSMVDSNAVFFLTNERLFVVSRRNSGDYRIDANSEIEIRGGTTMPVKEISAILAANDSDTYALTKTGTLLKGEYSRAAGAINDWTVAGVLPVYGKGAMIDLGPGEILIGGSSMVEYFTTPPRGPAKHLFSGSNTQSRPEFTVSIFDAGTTYGVGIGRFDENSADPFVYLVQLIGPNQLYRYRKGTTFPDPSLDIAGQSGVTGRAVERRLYRSNFTIGTAIGDIKEDGNDDIIVSYLSGPPLVLVNNGTGYFRDETDESGLNTDLLRSEGVTLADFNNDGYLDLFAASFVGSDRLFMNEGGGKFKDVTRESGLSSNGKSIVAVFGDLTGDGYPDLYVGRWNAPNLLYLNNGNGTFRNVTEESGTGCGYLHETNSVLLADFNNDGKLDIFVGNREGGNRLFLNEGGGHFKDVSKESGLLDSMYTYGSIFGDFEDDGRLDLIVDGLSTVRFYKNMGNDSNGVPVFKDRTSRFLPRYDFYNGYNTGAATFDADGNGDLDAIIGQLQGNTMFLRNNINSISGKHKDFIEVNVEGDQSNRDGIGAKVKLLKNGRMIAYREVMSTYGYASSSSRTQLFGITDPHASYEVEVDFPASGVKRIVKAVTGTVITVREHTGIARDYFLFRKDTTGFLLSDRFRMDVIESLLVLFIVLVLASVKLPFLGRAGRLRGVGEKVFVSVGALVVFVLLELAVYSLERIFFSPSRWITGPHDVVTNDLLPVFLTLSGAVAFLKSRERSESKQVLKREAYGRLYGLLRKFEHGEGPAMILNRLALFVENLTDLLSGGGFQVGEVGKGTEGRADDGAKHEPADPRSRFRAVLEEYEATVEKEIGAITATIGLIVDNGSESEKSEFLADTVAKLNIAFESLSKNVRILKTYLARTSIISKSGRRLRVETTRDIRVIKSALNETRKKFEREFVSEVGRIISEEIGKFRNEYRDLNFTYEDRSGGVRGIVREDELKEIVSILIGNSVEALGSRGDRETSGRIDVRTASTHPGIVIEIEDNGPGIPETERARIFSESFTTKGENHGFGLRYVSTCLSRYGGGIRLGDSRSGAKFLLTIEEAV